MRRPFIDVGDPGAPVGSPAWCRSAHATLCGLKRRTSSQVSSLKYSLIEFRDLERWKQLTDKNDEPFLSWEDYLQYPEPDGLGMAPASAKLVIEELDDSRLLGDVLAPREIGVVGGKAGPGRGHKTDSDTIRFIGRGRTYILARLDRDGFTQLSAKIRAGKLSANAAAIEAGFRHKQTPFEIVKRLWPKLAHAEQLEIIGEAQGTHTADSTQPTFGKNGSACAINWENHREDESETDAIVRARAVEWQLHEAIRLAEQFALRRRGTQRCEIKPKWLRKIGMVIMSWKNSRRKCFKPSQNRPTTKFRIPLRKTVAHRYGKP
jgi:hypothetical protein